MTYGDACQALQSAYNAETFCRALLLVPAGASTCVLGKFANMYSRTGCGAPPTQHPSVHACGPERGVLLLTWQ
jgi:hypothetical protein